MHLSIVWPTPYTLDKVSHCLMLVIQFMYIDAHHSHSDDLQFLEIDPLIVIYLPENQSKMTHPRVSYVTDN